MLPFLQSRRFNVMQTIFGVLGVLMLVSASLIAQPNDASEKDKAAAAQFAKAIVGKFANDAMSMFVELNQGKYQGTITRGDKAFPFTAELKDTKLIGQVDIGGAKTGFSATMEDDDLVLALGLDTQKLPRVVVVPPGGPVKNTVRKEALLATSEDVQAGSELASPDNRRIGFIIHRDGLRHAVIDGVVGKAYRLAGAIEFSLDSKRHSYIVEPSPGKRTVVVDGVEGESFENLLQPTSRFSADSKRVAYAGMRDNKWRAVIDGKQGEAYDELLYITFSPDSKRVGFAARRGKAWHAVIDGVEGEAFDGVGREGIHFSPDSRRVAYTAIKDGKQFTVIDGVQGKPCEAIGGFAFSPDSLRTYFVARLSGQNVFIVDGQDRGIYESIHNLSFSPDSKQTVLGVRHEGKVFHVVNDRPEPGYEDVTRPIFSPDHQQMVYAARQKAKWSLIRDGKSIRFHDQIPSMIFSPDGRRLAYVAIDENMARVVVDAAVSVRYDSIWSNSLYFTPDSRHLVMGASREVNTFLVVDSVEDKPVGSFVPGSQPVFDGNDRFHIITRRGPNYHRLDVQIINKGS